MLLQDFNNLHALSLLETLKYFDSHPEIVAYILKHNQLIDPKTRVPLSIASVLFVKSLVFEEDSDPDNRTVVYVIKNDQEQYGYFIDADGMYSEMMRS